MELTNIENMNIKPLLLVEQVSRILRDAILNGNLKGGDQLVEIELQKYFGISRTPLREAFRELEKAGFVEIIPRKGTFVRRLTLKDIDDTFPILANLEGLAARFALKRISKEELEALEKALEGMTRAAEEDDEKAYLEPHVRFHEIYIRASGNDLLLDVLSRLKTRIVWHRFYYRYHKGKFSEYLSVHRRIIDLFRNPLTSEDTIEKAVKDSILSAYSWVRRHLPEQDETGAGGEGAETGDLHPRNG